jgi:hypothetical protein
VDLGDYIGLRVASSPSFNPKTTMISWPERCRSTLAAP